MNRTEKKYGESFSVSYSDMKTLLYNDSIASGTYKVKAIHIPTAIESDGFGDTIMKAKRDAEERAADKVLKMKCCG